MKIIIAGAYAIGTYLAKLLSRNNNDIILTDDDAERLEQLGTDFDLMTLCASCTSIQALKDAGIEKADLFIAVTPNESRNMTSCTLAQALGAKKTVAKIDNYEYTQPELEQFFRSEEHTSELQSRQYLVC